VGKSGGSNPPFDAISKFKGTRLYAGFPYFDEIGLRAKHDCSGNWEHFNLIFPDYLKLMTGFPSVYPDEVGAGFLY
jgi:hypothetical protein